jgi:WD40 repeat protein
MNDARTHRNAAYAITVAPDGSWLAVVGLYPGVQVWDVATGRHRFVLEGHRTAVFAAAVAPDGSWLATAGGDGTVRIWDMTTGKQREVLEGHRDTPRQRQHPTWSRRSSSPPRWTSAWPLAVHSVAVSSDGNWLASGGADRTIRVWETGRWKARAMMRVENAIHACTWLNDGSLACGGPAGLYLFDFLSGNTAAITNPPTM